MKRVICTMLLAACWFGAHAQEMRTERFLLYRVQRIDAADVPIIDGKLDEALWRDRPALSSLRNFLGPKAGEFASQQSEFVVLTDGCMLYLGITFHDDDMASVRYDPAKDAFWNDCTELYFDPRHDGKRSIQLVVDCGGGRFWEKRYDEGYGWWVDTAWYMLADWRAATWRGPDRWTVELAIDAASFGIDTAPGSVCGFNPCRFRLGAKDQEFSAWGFGGMQRQKNMSAWGHLLFAEPGAAHGAGITREDVARVYPDLTGLRIEVPVAEGFEVFTADGQSAVDFGELLSGKLTALQEQLVQTRDALLALDIADARARAIRDALPSLEEKAGELARQATASGVTLGGYDRLSEALVAARDELHELEYRARLLTCVLDVTGG